MDLLKSISVDPEIKSKKYLYNNNYVPRVTEILSAMLHEDYLLGWANHLGFTNKRYSTVMKGYCDVGTGVHDTIEKYLKHNILDYSNIPNEHMRQVENGVRSFLEWFEIIKINTEYNILEIEEELVCNRFGGTCDLLIDINDKVYLIDFKTSKNISYKHFLQLSAYRYMYSLKGINIDGVMILQLNKEDVIFTEHLVDLSLPEGISFIDSCTETFMGLVYSYYNRLAVESNFKTFFK